MQELLAKRWPQLPRPCHPRYWRLFDRTCHPSIDHLGSSSLCKFTESPLQAGYSRSRIAQPGWAGPHSPMSRKRSRFVLSLPRGFSMLHLASHPCSASACRDGELHPRKHWDALLLSVCPHIFVLHILYCCSKQANPVREWETTCIRSPRHGA